MKKFGIAVILLAVVVGVSYLNAVRQESNEQDRYREGYSKGAAEAQTASHRADSIAGAAAQYQSVYRDSLQAIQNLRRAERDSLSSLLASKEQEISALQKRARASVTRQKAASKESSSTNLKHAQILDFYKRKLAGLPKDLSEYERGVALTEIREETIKKFSITSTELDKIRQGGNIAD